MKQRTKRRIALAAAFLLGVTALVAAPRVLAPDPLAKPAYEERVRAAYGHHYERLVELKRRYDPENVLRRNQNIKP